MKRTVFTFLFALLMTTLSTTATAQQWSLEASNSFTKEGGTVTDSVAFASDNTVYAIYRRWYRRWNLNTNTSSGWGKDKHIYDMAIPIDNPSFFAYTQGNQVRMVYTSDNSWRGSFTMGGGYGSIRRLAVSADGKRMVTAKRSGGNTDALINVWDVSSPNARIIKSHIWVSDQDFFRDIAMDTKGSYMFVTDDKKTDERAASSGKMSQTYTSRSKVDALAYEGGYIASGCRDGEVDIWHYNPPKFVRTLWHATDEIKDVTFSKDGKYVAAASYDGNAYVWEMSSGKLLATLDHPGPWVTAIAFSPSGHIATMEGGTIYFWRKSNVENPVNRVQTTLDESKRKLDSATLINGLKIDKSRMRQMTKNGATVEDSFWYYGDNHFILLDQFKSTCGTTSAEMVLHYYGKDVGQGDIWGENGLLNWGIDDILGGGAIHNVEIGSFPREIEQALDRLGVPADWYHRGTLDHLKQYVRENRPPIILLRFAEFLHYVVVVGYNSDGDFLIADPNNVFRWLTSEEMRLGWSLNDPGLPKRYSVRDGFKKIALEAAAVSVDIFTGGENMIVPKRPATRHFPANWSELEAIEVTGDRDFNPNWNTRAWDRTLDFNNNFVDYRLSTTTPSSVSNLWNLGVDSAWVTEHKQIAPDKVKVWGRATYGKWTRGKVWVFVRAYRHNKGNLVAAASVTLGDSLDDPFEGTALQNSNWKWRNEPANWDVGRTRKDFLHIEGETNRDLWTSDASHFLYQETSADTFDVETHFFTKWDTSSGVNGLVVKSRRDNDWVTLKFWARDAAAKGHVQYQAKGRGLAANPAWQPQFGATELFFRLRKDGNTYTGWYKTREAGAWIKIGSANVKLTPPLQLGIYAGVAARTGTLTVDYEYFRSTVDTGVLGSPALHVAAMKAPEETTLLPNYPNPFNPETWIPYQLSSRSDVTVEIYAVNGRLVRRLSLGHQDAGMYHGRSRAAYWDGRNEFGEPVASGIYFYTLKAGDFIATRKMLIQK